MSSSLTVRRRHLIMNDGHRTLATEHCAGKCSIEWWLPVLLAMMMLWPHATKVVGQATVLNTPYVILTFVAMALSAFLLWYTELPDVRLGLERD